MTEKKVKPTPGKHSTNFISKNIFSKLLPFNPNNYANPNINAVGDR